MSERRKVLIGLKHSLPAGTEIHAVLPDTWDEIEAEARELGLEAMVGPPESAGKPANEDTERG